MKQFGVAGFPIASLHVETLCNDLNYDLTIEVGSILFENNRQMLWMISITENRFSSSFIK